MTATTSQTEVTRLVLQEMYDAALKMDLPRFFACFDEKIVIDEPSFLPYGGSHAGIEKFTKMVTTINQYMDFKTIQLDKLIADGDTAVAFVRVQSVKAPGVVQLAERSIVRDGKIIDVRVHFFELGGLIADIQR